MHFLRQAERAQVGKLAIAADFDSIRRDVIPTDCITDPETLLRRKWRGIEELHLLMEGIASLIRDERSEFETRLAENIGNKTGITIGSQVCENSPSRTCVYEFALGGKDECLICGRANGSLSTSRSTDGNA